MNMGTTGQPARSASRPAGDRVAHIDGLRAIAVLAVVGYHAGLPGFGGGYVGVDIFFVISGYLIINHIVEEIGRGTFGFGKFYARRVIRLLPPLFAMLIGSLVLALAILVSQYEWDWFALSAVFASLSAANFYFLSKQGYFDVDMYEKVLLHTWSLSVEEQFYIVAPVLILGCFFVARRLTANPYRLLAVVAALVFAASLVGCILHTSLYGRNAGFYMTHWRAWEFVAGGAIGYALNARSRAISPLILSIAAAIGLALTVLPVMLYARVAAYPSAWPLAPVAGTAILIVTGFLAPASFVSRLLSLRVLGFVGLVSYGWYLWHWPLISFARIADFGEQSMARDIVMAALAFGLAVATWRWIERPARAWRMQHDLDRIGLRVFATAIVASISLAAVSGAIGGGMYLYDKRAEATASDPASLIDAVQCPAPCEQAKGSHGVVVGDSHADRLYDVFSLEAEKAGATLDKVEIVTPREADFAVIMMRWTFQIERQDRDESPQQVIRYLRENLDQWSTMVRGPILLVGPTPEFDYKIGNCIPRAVRYGMDRDRCTKPRAEVEARRAETVAMLKGIAAAHPHMRYVDPIDIFCDEKLCRPYVGDAILFKDNDHVTVPYGGYFLLEGIRRDIWWLLRGGNVADAAASAS